MKTNGSDLDLDTSVKFSGYLDTWILGYLSACQVSGSLVRWYKDIRLEKRGVHLTGIYF